MSILLWIINKILQKHDPLKLIRIPHHPHKKLASNPLLNKSPDPDPARPDKYNSPRS